MNDVKWMANQIVTILENIEAKEDWLLNSTIKADDKVFFTKIDIEEKKEQIIVLANKIINSL